MSDCLVPKPFLKEPKIKKFVYYLTFVSLQSISANSTQLLNRSYSKSVYEFRFTMFLRHSSSSSAEIILKIS